LNVPPDDDQNCDAEKQIVDPAHDGISRLFRETVSDAGRFALFQDQKRHHSLEKAINNLQH